ncbi:MAG: ATP-binding cassette domain-containing protein [bacterium]|nr:ATP-binding cassette domain-containing protein [bacterium]
MTNNSIELVSLRKAYGDFVAVRDLSLRIPGGAVFGLLGPNGAGKTTTIRMMMDIMAPDTGEVRFFGRPRSRADLKRVGYLPEERGLYRKMSVFDHLVFLGELHGVGKRQSGPKIEDWLARVGLAGQIRQKVEELSKGMQQKVQLVGTLLHDPEIVILDEPFSGLDPINQGLFKDVLAEYRERGKTVLFSTHVMEQAEKLCDALALISGGRVILSGGMAEIKSRYGGLAYRLVASGDLARLSAIQGIESHLVLDGYVRLLLSEEARPAEILRALVENLEVREFRSEEPSLEEIFIATVGDDKARGPDEAESGQE